LLKLFILSLSLLSLHRMADPEEQRKEIGD